MVSEAKEKLLEYRQIVIVDFFLFNLSELVGSIGCMVIGSFLKYGYNKDLYPLVKVLDWPNAIKLAGENMCEVVAYILGITSIVVLGLSGIFIIYVYRSLKSPIFTPFLGWMQKNVRVVIVCVTYGLFMPYYVLFSLNKCIPNGAYGGNVN